MSDRSTCIPPIAGQPEAKLELRMITPAEGRDDGAETLFYEDGVEFKCLKYLSHEEWFEIRKRP